MASNTGNIIDIRQVFAQNLDRYMKEHRISRKKMCEDLGFKYTTLTDWVKGNTSPKPEAVRLMCDYFDIEVSDFYIETERPSDSTQRLLAYAGKGKVLDQKVLSELSDDQVKELLKNGFTFKHKTLEERISEYGGKLELDGEFDWGEPVGREVWR